MKTPSLPLSKKCHTRQTPPPNCRCVLWTAPNGIATVVRQQKQVTAWPEHRKTLFAVSWSRYLYKINEYLNLSMWSLLVGSNVLIIFAKNGCFMSRSKSRLSKIRALPWQAILTLLFWNFAFNFNIMKVAFRILFFSRAGFGCW